MKSSVISRHSGLYGNRNQDCLYQPSKRNLRKNYLIISCYNGVVILGYLYDEPSAHGVLTKGIGVGVTKISSL